MAGAGHFLNGNVSRRLFGVAACCGWLARKVSIYLAPKKKEHGPEKNVYKLKNARCGGADAVVVASTSILIIALYWPLMAQKWRTFGALLRLSFCCSPLVSI